MTKGKDLKMALRRDAGYRKAPAPNENVRGPEYAMSFACFTCKTAHKRHFENSPSEYPRFIKCPICKECAINVGRNFKAPKKSDTSQWKKVKYLVENGFVFQHIYEEQENGSLNKVEYPKTLNDAKEFVLKYKSQAINNALITNRST